VRRDAGKRSLVELGVRTTIATPRRVRTAARNLHGAWEWGVALRGIGWLTALPVLKHVMPLPTLTRLMWRGGKGRRRQRRREQRAAAIVGGLSRRAGGNCLERSLLLYRVLSRLNADPVLVAGMGKSGDFIGHAWVEVEGETLLESPQSLAPYVEVVRFGADGLCVRAQDD